MPNIFSVLRESLSLWMRRPFPLTVIALPAYPFFASPYIIGGAWPGLVTPASWFGLSFVSGALIHALAATDRRESPSVADSYRLVMGQAGSVVGVTLRTYGAFILLGITVIGIPFAVRILVRWFFGLQAVVLHRLGGREAIGMSCRLVEGRWWRLFGTALLIAVLFSLPSAPVTILSFMGLLPDSLRLAPAGVSTLLLPLGNGFWTLLFLRLSRTVPAAP